MSGLHIVPMRHGDRRGNFVEVHPCEPDKAQFWGLYQRGDDGLVEWVADFDTEALAIAAMERAA